MGQPRGITREQGKARIIHLSETKDPLQIDDEHEDAGQKATLKRAVLIGEASLGNVPPARSQSFFHNDWAWP